ncbi:hypothetical protein [Mesorhizobium sp. GbtcB19]|uniref:hypothetical protein n=1 Tax=Mesorhizobium sp. GbtcB19 TaxID=2824764 RepID=UPI001C2F4532|nr:hypothetical protein [Mesorhizobium sp. GbtcB19]
MTSKDDLEQLRQHALALEKSIDDIDQEIDSAIQAHTGSGQMVAYLRDRHNAQMGLMYDLGKIEARIEPLEERLREAGEQHQERLAADQWQENQPLASEDHLDWFKQSLTENPPALDELDRAEQQMLHEMEREPTPEDHLDWLPGRRG